MLIKELCVRHHPRMPIALHTAQLYDLSPTDARGQTLGLVQEASLPEESLCIQMSPPHAQCMPPSPCHQQARLDTA